MAIRAYEERIKELESQVILLKKENTKLKKQTAIDELTGCHNYKCFLDILKHRTASAERKHNHFSLVMIDIDNFRDFNNQFKDHQNGDEVLKGIGGILKSVKRAEDWVFRVSGDEFAVVTENGYAKVIAKRIKDSLGRKKFMLNTGDSAEGFAVSCSMGVVQYEQGMGVKGLRKAADALLYHVKDNGRNGYAYREGTVIYLK